MKPEPSKTSESREPRHLRPVDPTAPWRPDEEPALATYLGVLLASRWLVTTVILVAVTAGAAYVLLAAPRYRSDILVQVEEKAPGLGFDALSDVFSGKTPAETEMEIIRSRSLVGSVVDELGLDVEARPRTLPVLGGAAYRRHRGGQLAAPVLGLARFAWGGERIGVTRLDVPEELLDQPLTLVAGAGGAFTLRSPESGELLAGRVGALATGDGVSLWVSDLRARPGTEFHVMRIQRETAIRDLQDALRIAEKGKKTGVLQVALDGEDRRRTAAILDAFSRNYLRQNVERKSAEAQKTLEFLETQLPELKTKLETAEAALESYRAKKGSVDVSLETQATLARAVELERAVSELEVQRAELKQRFTDSHPLLATVQDKIGQLATERSRIEERLKKLPQSELDSARLIRDAKVAQELYVLLLNKAQELRIVKSGTIANVRILDSANVPVKPVAPMKAVTLVLSLVLGVVLAVGLAFLRRAATRRIEDPEVIERETGLSVYASVPRSEGEVRLSRSRDENKLLAAVDPMDLAVESMRSLRTGLQFALLEAPNRVLTVLGPAPSIGKSFCSVNLAAVLAESGKRVVVVDADLRKGRLHKYLGGSRGHGVSEVVSGAESLDAVIRKTSVANLDFIATGRTPPNSAGLLNSERFSAVLEELSARYDQVIVDTAPVLAVTDAVLVARHSGVNLLVLRAGRHPMREIQAALRRLEQGGVTVHGAVLNDVRVGLSYGGYHYQYAYGRSATGE